MPDYQPIDYRLRCHTKRTDLPVDVLRDIGEAYAEIERLRNERNAFEAERDELIRISNKLKRERDEARRRVCENAIQHGRVYRRVGRDTVRCETPQQVAEVMGWDCYKENKENTND